MLYSDLVYGALCTIYHFVDFLKCDLVGSCFGI